MADSGTENTPPPRPPAETSFQAISRILTSRTNESVMFVVRVVTIVMTILYMIPFFPNSETYYQKALLANAATSALRLHQRLPPFQLSREFLAMVLVEDSAHYLIYSLVFVSNKPMTMVLLPIFLFALLHSCSFLLSILQSANVANGAQQLLTSIIQRYQTDILFTIAISEIVILPSILLGIITGLMSIFSPIMYYQFVVLRYSSVRNPYSKNAFHVARQQTEKFARSPRCPQIASSILLKMIDITCRLAPQTVRQ